MLFPSSPVPVSPEVTGALLDAASTAASARAARIDDARFVASLLRVGAVSQALSASGVDVVDAGQRLRRLTADQPRRPWYRPMIGSFRPWRTVQQAGALAAASGLAELTGPFVLATLMAETEEQGLVDALRAAGFSLLRYRWQVAHGALADAACLAGEVRVFLHNDPFTTMDFVVEILRTIFHHDEGTARTLMHRVHTEGSVAIGAMDAREAASIIARVRGLADVLKLPIRFTVSRVDGGP